MPDRALGRRWAPPWRRLMDQRIQLGIALGVLIRNPQQVTILVGGNHAVVAAIAALIDVVVARVDRLARGPGHRGAGVDNDLRIRGIGQSEDGTDVNVTGNFFGGGIGAGAGPTPAAGTPASATPPAGAGAAGAAAAGAAAASGSSVSVRRPFQMATAFPAISVAQARRLSGSVTGISVGESSSLPNGGVPAGDPGAVGSTVFRDWLTSLILTVTVTPVSPFRVMSYFLPPPPYFLAVASPGAFVWLYRVSDESGDVIGTRCATERMTEETARLPANRWSATTSLVDIPPKEDASVALSCAGARSARGRACEAVSDRT